MKLSKLSLLIPLFLLTSLAWSDQLIVEPDMGRKPVIDLINSAQQTIDIVMYGWTDKELLDSVIRKNSSGTTVKVLLEETPYKSTNENQKTIQMLLRNNIAFNGTVPPYRLIHQKTLIIDRKKALVMTFNFTRSSFSKERNFALLIDNSKKVATIKNVFTDDWNHKASLNDYSELIYSPDDSRKKLINLIEFAKHNIKIYAQTISDYQLNGVLAKAARNNISVQIITSKKLREKQAAFLERNGVVIHYLKHLYVHAKTMIIDNKLAVIGSINLTKSSLDDNRELSVITYDKNVINEINNVFNHDWLDAAPLFTRQSRKKINSNSHRKKLQNFSEKTLILKAILKYLTQNKILPH